MVHISIDKINNKKQLAKACNILLKKVRREDEGVKAIRGDAQGDFVNFAEMFLFDIQEQNIPENIGDGWCYQIEINENYCNLWLHHVKDTDHGRAIDKSFDLISEEAPMLSAKEYAELHDYTEEQVLDWLNRGKFRKAFMRKGKWRIPAYGEPCRGFIDGVFFIHEPLECLPENLQYLDKYFRVATKTDDDGTNLVLCMGGVNDKDTGYRRIKEKRVVSDEEREQIEAIFAADEDVVCTYSSLYIGYFERY